MTRKKATNPDSVEVSYNLTVHVICDDKFCFGVCSISIEWWVSKYSHPNGIYPIHTMTRKKATNPDSVEVSYNETLHVPL